MIVRSLLESKVRVATQQVARVVYSVVCIHITVGDSDCVDNLCLGYS